jgi:hypothetical protein
MQAVEFLLTLARRKLVFLLVLVAAGFILFTLADDWSWPHFVLLMVLLFALLLFWALVSFWIMVFRGTKTPEAK